MKEDTPAEQREEVRRHLKIVDLIAARDAEGARAAVVSILSEFTQTAKRAANAA
jgi:DNA-binding FadR family transcriptional regulator